MSWSLALQVRDGEVNIVSKTTQLPDMNITLNGHEDANASNVSAYIGTVKK
jgi:hypothetical protein